MKIEINIGILRAEHDVENKSYNIYMYDLLVLSSPQIEDDSKGGLAHAAVMMTDILQLDKTTGGRLLSLSKEEVEKIFTFKNDILKKMSDPKLLNALGDVFGPEMKKALEAELSKIAGPVKPVVSTKEEIDEILAELEAKHNENIVPISNHKNYKLEDPS
jgi:hypothetical protein